MGCLTIAIRKCVTVTMIVTMVIMFVKHADAETDDDEGRKFLDKVEKCWEDCGGDSTAAKERLEGSVICHYSEGLKDFAEMHTKCHFECVGVLKPAENQAKCLCDFCKAHKRHEFFCEKPGVKTHISKEDCEKEVCAGNPKIMYRDEFCNARDEADFEAMKNKIKN